MARSTLSIVCLTLVILHKFIDCETWGDLSETLETNVGISINETPTKILQLMSRNITEEPKNAIAETLEIPKTIEYRGRIVKTPPKSRAPAPAAAPKTIRYRLGKRVAGNRNLN